VAAKEPLRLEIHAQRDEQTTPDFFQASGTVKWFDLSKGYGFIAADDNLPDILLHVTCLRHSGLQTIREGTRMVCEVMKSPRGLQAVQISSVDESTAIHPSHYPSAPMRPSSPRVTGKEWW
jgi:CspA family cold shock protein